MAYPLPDHVAAVLSAEPDPPRRVSLGATAGAVLLGADCSIYAGAGLVFIALGFISTLPTQGHASSFAPLPLAAGVVVLGVVFCGLALYRVLRVAQVLRSGDAFVATVTSADVGMARIYGTP